MLTPQRPDFADFVGTAATRLLRTAELLTGDRHQAEDLVQAALEKAYLRWHRIRSDDPYGYVRRVLVNTHNDWWRRKPWRERATGELPEEASADVSEEHAKRDAVFRALATLTPRERTVVVLRYYEDLSEEATATALGVAVGTVKSTAARAFAKLRITPDIGEVRLTRPVEARP
ncbi:SigE family RNA polymerase sigma factor [Fodinicola acaciae]|uniref:SigE family RNA polymerase sigma factor n=1 Tax=Fodinicola acaciae TaxID=2681555 RepID=UPI0013D10DE7|nr:SigE family RNA polymerase sigma factor [Fodinicola acaciae]